MMNTQTFYDKSGSSLSNSQNGLQYIDKGWVPYPRDTMDTTHFVFDTNDVIINRSCRDM